jgi:hypothetical protein
LVLAAAQAPAGPASVRTADLTDPEWKQAIGTASAHVADHRQGLLANARFSPSSIPEYVSYSLARVILVDPQPGETVNAAILNTKELTADYHGGGSLNQRVNSGDFVFIDHVVSARRKDGRDPLILSSPHRGTSTVWVSVPTDGELGIVGDIVIPEDR